MDLNTVEVVSVPTSRDELWPLGPGDAVLAGGTWLFSERQPHLRRLVDINALGWQPIVLSDTGIEMAATCTVAEVSRLSADLTARRPDWAAAPLLQQCCAALLASFKIWESATVGGNICLSFPAGAMISLASALDGRVMVWRADGGRFVLSVTAATVRPYVFGFPSVPDAGAMQAALAALADDAWTRDPHGDPDWRRAMTLLLGEQIRAELT